MGKEDQKFAREIDQHQYLKALLGPDAQWVHQIPDSVPAGRVLAHVPSLLGAWLAPPNPEKFRVCDCGWAPGHSQHFRVLGQD